MARRCSFFAARCVPCKLSGADANLSDIRHAVSLRIIVTKKQGCAVARNAIRRRIFYAMSRSIDNTQICGVFRESKYKKELRKLHLGKGRRVLHDVSNVFKLSISGYKAVIGCDTRALDESCYHMIKTCCKEDTAS